ncbi:MAG: hypothetical protein HY538_09160 [Deltaproteobacteria bacterium]|nr:hypothetical protein [Deltaproteobacteria bacterium]
MIRLVDMKTLPKMSPETQGRIEELARLAQESDASCFLVGGMLRDWVLGKDPKDIDILVMPPKSPIEFAETLHQKGGYRFPTLFPTFGTLRTGKEEFEVEIVPPRGTTLIEDLKLRDFTINTLVFPLTLPLASEISDPLEMAFKDIQAKRIRTSIDPVPILRDDPLRALRAIRLATTLGFEIEEALQKAIREHREWTREVASERIQEELAKILVSQNPSRGLRLMGELGLLEVLFPEIQVMVGKEQKSPYHHQDVFEHSLTVLEKSPPDLSVRLAALLHDQGKVYAERKEGDRWVYWGHEFISEKNARALLERLCFPHKIRDEALFLIKHHMVPYAEDWGDSAVRRFAHRAGPYLQKLLQLLKADTGALRPEHACPEKYDQLFERIHGLHSEEIHRIQLPLDGKEIMELLNLRPGPQVGEAKQLLLDAILDGKLSPEDKEGAQNYLKGTLRAGKG